MPLPEKNNALEIGSKIKSLRISYGRTLQEISSCTSLSTLVLSEIENENYCVFLRNFHNFLNLPTCMPSTLSAVLMNI
jgi:cytoskeletal protein RodZ